MFEEEMPVYLKGPVTILFVHRFLYALCITRYFFVIMFWQSVWISDIIFFLISHSINKQNIKYKILSQTGFL